MEATDTSTKKINTMPVLNKALMKQSDDELSTKILVPMPTPPSSKKPKSNMKKKPKTPNRKNVKSNNSKLVVVNGSDKIEATKRIVSKKKESQSKTVRVEYVGDDLSMSNNSNISHSNSRRRRRRPSSAPSKRRYFPADDEDDHEQPINRNEANNVNNMLYGSIDMYGNANINNNNNNNNINNPNTMTKEQRDAIIEENALILSQLEISNSMSNTPNASIGHRSGVKPTSIAGSTTLNTGRPQTSGLQSTMASNLSAMSDNSGDHSNKEVKHVFFHNTKLQAHATRRFSAAENKRLKGRVEHLQRKEAKMKKEIYDYYTHMEKRIKILRDQKRLRQELNRARADTAKRNTELNNAARNIHRNLDAAKEQRQNELRIAARKTAEESKRNMEAYHNLKLKRVQDNRKIRDKIHAKRRKGTRRAMAFQNKKINAVIQSRRAAVTKENEKHKKRLIKNERLHRKEAAMRELLDNLYDYKLTYQAQLEGMCRELEQEVCEMRRKGREGIVFSVPKAQKGKKSGGSSSSSSSMLEENNLKVQSNNKKKNKIPKQRRKGRKGYSHISPNTPRSLMSAMDHHLSEFEEEHHRTTKVNYYDSKNW